MGLKGLGPVLLKGPLGSGKTTFAKGFVKELGAPPSEISSPSFTLANIYEGRGKIKIAHLDLYRLGMDGDPESSLKEFLEAGLDEHLSGLSLIEWPERLPLPFYQEGSMTVLIEPIRGPRGGSAGASSSLGPHLNPDPGNDDPDLSPPDAARRVSFILGFDPGPLKAAIQERGLGLYPG